MRWTEGNESVFKNQFLFPAFRMEFNSIWNRICSCLLSYWILVSIGLWLTHMSLALVWLLRIWLFIICKVIDIIFIVISEIKEASQVGLSGRNYMKNAILQSAVGIFALTNEWERGWQTHTVKRVWKRLRVVRVCLPLHKHTHTHTNTLVHPDKRKSLGHPPLCWSCTNRRSENPALRGATKWVMKCWQDILLHTHRYSQTHA